MTNTQRTDEQPENIPCSCPKGGAYEMENGNLQVCKRCDGTEWVKNPRYVPTPTDESVVDWEKAPYVFQFSYLGNDGKEHYEVMQINDHMNVEDAVKMAYQHAREHPKGRVNTFASTSLLTSQSIKHKAEVEKARKDGYTKGVEDECERVVKCLRVHCEKYGSDALLHLIQKLTSNPPSQV